MLKVMDYLSIGKLSKESGFSVQAIRYYEKNGLIVCQLRSSSGYRKFHPSTVALLKFIEYHKKLGFTLNEIKQLLTFQEDPEEYKNEILGMFRKKLEHVSEKIMEYSRMREILEATISGYLLCEYPAKTINLNPWRNKKEED